MNRIPLARLLDRPACAECGAPLSYPSHVVELEGAHVQQAIDACPIPLVVDFYATWCGFCTQLAPRLELAASRFKGRVLIVKANADRNPAAVQRYRANGLPTLVAFRDGQPVDRREGLMPQDTLNAWVESVARGG